MRINKFWYYALNYTWGLPLTIVGWLVAFVLRITGHKPVMKYGPCLVFSVGGRLWGGFSIGTTIVVDTDPSNFPDGITTNTEILSHEFGHSLQNAMFGPFMLFVVSIPSMIRYWWATIKQMKDPKFAKNFDYYSIWFEGTASEWGSWNYVMYWMPAPPVSIGLTKESVEKLLNGPRVVATKNKDGSTTIEHIDKGE